MEFLVFVGLVFIIVMLTSGKKNTAKENDLALKQITAAIARGQLTLEAISDSLIRNKECWCMAIVDKEKRVVEFYERYSSSDGPCPLYAVLDEESFEICAMYPDAKFDNLIYAFKRERDLKSKTGRKQ